MNKIRHTALFEIAQSAEDLFPLFSAEEEREDLLVTCIRSKR